MEIYHGKVIIQTYNPDNFSIICSKEQDYERFYNAELNIRRHLQYPPFCDIILCNVMSSSEREIEVVTKFIYEELVKYTLKKALIYKPQPFPINKINNTYRWRIIMKCKFGNNIIKAINIVLNNFQSKRKIFTNTNINFDVNPNNLQ